MTYCVVLTVQAMARGMVSNSVDPELAELFCPIQLVAFDFDGVFTDNRVYVFDDGTEAVACWRSDGIGLRKLDRLGIRCVVISSEANPVVSVRCRKLDIACIQNAEDKLEILKALADESGIPLKRVAFVGNDSNDAGCLMAVGLPIIVADAHESVLPLARFRTTARGGHGAVRETCDLFEESRKLVADPIPSAP